VAILEKLEPVTTTGPRAGTPTRAATPPRVVPSTPRTT